MIEAVAPSAYEGLSARGLISAALTAPPSTELVALLQTLDVFMLDAGLQVDLMVVWERAAAWMAALALPVIAAVGDVAFTAAEKTMKGLRYSADMPYRAAHAEIGLALRLSEKSGQERLDMARMIAVELPAVQQALEAGDISYWHAVAIAQAAQELAAPADRTWIAAKVLPKARYQTVAALRRCLRRLLLAVNPKTASKRHAEAVAERTLEWFVLPDGMAQLRLTATGSDVKAVFNTVDAAAKTMPKKTPEGAHIPIAARRADALVNMITGTSGGAAPPGTAGTGTAGTGTAGGAGTAKRLPASIHVVVDLPTVLGLADNPAELAGYGPIPAELARALAADGKWRRLICDPLTGALLDLGTTSYTPNAALERYLHIRDMRCTFPNCHQPAHRCEIDHTNPWRSGNPATGTDRCNTGCLCEYHHDVKHLLGWHLTRDPDDHTGGWSSPTGHHYPAPHHDHRPVTANDHPREPDDPAPTIPTEGAIEISWIDWQYLMPHEDDGQSDWDSFVQNHQSPPDPTDLEPAYEPHEDYNFGNDDEPANS